MPCRRLWQLIVLYGAAAALGCALLSPGAGAQDRPDEPERQDKAAFLDKFGSYVTWPDGAFARPDSPFVIGIAGADELADQRFDVAVDAAARNGLKVSALLLSAARQVRGW